MLRIAVFVFAAAAALPSSAPVAEAKAPNSGPGGVRAAALRVLRAIDANDLESLRACSAPLTAPRVGAPEPSESEAEFSLSVHDVGFDGEAWSVETAEAWSRTRAEKLVDGEGRGPTSSLVSIRANCPSAECSYAVLEFDRTWGTGEAATAQHLRATALFEYVGDGGGVEFRLVHWHASPRATD